MLTEQEFDSFVKALGLRIRSLRKEKNVNMRDIMIETGFYDSQWRKYESGGGLNLRSLMKVAQGLKVTLAELLDGLGQWPLLSVREIQAQHHILPEAEPDPVDEAEPITQLTLRRVQGTKKTVGKVAAPKTAIEAAGRSPRPSRKTSK